MVSTRTGEKKKSKKETNKREQGEMPPPAAASGLQSEFYSDEEDDLLSSQETGIDIKKVQTKNALQMMTLKEQQESYGKLNMEVPKGLKSTEVETKQGPSTNAFSSPEKIKDYILDHVVNQIQPRFPQVGPRELRDALVIIEDLTPGLLFVHMKHEPNNFFVVAWTREGVIEGKKRLGQLSTLLASAKFSYDLDNDPESSFRSRLRNAADEMDWQREEREKCLDILYDAESDLQIQTEFLRENNDVFEITPIVFDESFEPTPAVNEEDEDMELVHPPLELPELETPLVSTEDTGKIGATITPSRDDGESTDESSDIAEQDGGSPEKSPRKKKLERRGSVKNTTTESLMKAVLDRLSNIEKELKEVKDENTAFKQEIESLRLKDEQNKLMIQEMKNNILLDSGKTVKAQLTETVTTVKKVVSMLSNIKTSVSQNTDVMNALAGSKNTTMPTSGPIAPFSNIGKRNLPLSESMSDSDVSRSSKAEKSEMVKSNDNLYVLAIKTEMNNLNIIGYAQEYLMLILRPLINSGKWDECIAAVQKSELPSVKKTKLKEAIDRLRNDTETKVITSSI